jgi:hypothetical protein
VFLPASVWLFRRSEIAATLGENSPFVAVFTLEFVGEIKAEKGWCSWTANDNQGTTSAMTSYLP